VRVLGVKNWNSVIHWRWTGVEEITPEVIAIDFPNYMTRRTSVMRPSRGQRIPMAHVRIVYSTIRQSLRRHILPVFIFDGPPEHLKRCPNPDLISRAESLYRQYSKSGDTQDSEVVESLRDSRALSLYFSANHASDICKACGVPMVKAPSEAELAGAILCRDGEVGSVVSNDADALLFGSPHVTRSLHLSEGRIECAQLSELEESLGLNLDQLRDLAIICGCDFHRKGIKGLGPRRGAVQLHRHGDLKTLLRSLGLTTDEMKEYLDARETFDEAEYVRLRTEPFSLKPPIPGLFRRLLSPVVGVSGAEKMLAELVRLWKDFGRVQTTLEHWI